MLTKGKMINELNKAGVRYGKRQNDERVKISHLKTPDIINMYYDTFKK